MDHPKNAAITELLAICDQIGETAKRPPGPEREAETHRLIAAVRELLAKNRPKRAPAPNQR